MVRLEICIIIFVLLLSLLLIPNTHENSFAVLNSEKIKHITLVASEKVLEIAPSNNLYPGGIFYKALTYNGSIPGPTIDVKQGDILNFTLKNADDIVHSIDFHGIGIPSQAISGSIKPGESKNWKILTENPGVYVYHCDGDNLNGIWEHISSGMFGGIIIHPKNQIPAKEFFISFNEIYNDSSPGLFIQNNGTVGSFDMTKFMQNQPDFVLTNGMAFKYFPAMGTIVKIPLNEEADMFKVKTGELTRWYIINAGPRNEITFNFAGGMIDKIDGTINKNYNNSTSNRLYETIIPPGGGKIIETIFLEEGIYFGNDHDISSLLKGSGFVVSSDKN
ncbi:MAG: multicopper oxidase domain-containing protein [Nitrososphaeraceae archaeon]